MSMPTVLSENARSAQPMSTKTKMVSTVGVHILKYHTHSRKPHTHCREWGECVWCVLVGYECVHTRRVHTIHIDFSLADFFACFPLADFSLHAADEYTSTDVYSSAGGYTHRRVGIHIGGWVYKSANVYTHRRGGVHTSVHTYAK